jgi:SlyX protein
MTAHISAVGPGGRFLWPDTQNDNNVEGSGPDVQRLFHLTEGRCSLDSNDDQLQERVLLLEESAAHQSQTIDELSAQLAAQWKIIDHMQVKLDRLTEQFRALEDASFEAPANARPPHY